MNQQAYRLKQIERQAELLKMDTGAPGFDPDIWQLEYAITEIAPYSRAWRAGRIRALRRAITALKRENARKAGAEDICAVCGKPVERVHPCGYYRRFNQATCDECCEECFQSEPFPCEDHDARFRADRRDSKCSTTSGAPASNGKTP